MRFAIVEPGRAVSLIVERCKGGPYSYVVTPNVAHIVKAHEEPETLLPIYRGAWLSLCDSQIVRGLAALRRIELPLATGSDLVASLLAQQNALTGPEHARHILVVGPDAAVERVLRDRYANADIEVMPAPTGLAKRADLRLQVAEDCAARQWDLLLLCFGSPAQELVASMIADLGRQNGVALCVGASIDFLTGSRSRAPRWMQNSGLEWAYRLGSEPGRLWRRYLLEGPRIFSIFLAARDAAPTR